MAGFSADGDGRLLTSMIFNSKFESNTERNHLFDQINDTICFLQDIIHIATKLRNRLLNILFGLLIGNEIASVAHLKILINLVPKDVHGLVYSDICPDDRQNFSSLQKIMEPRVRAALQKYVIGSDGTIEYIRICHEIVSSLYNDNLSPLNRIYLIWRSTFFLRACRLSITKASDDKINIENNFITTNTFSCIELNAKNLIILTKMFRDGGLKKYFIPNIFNSQPCEETFRKMRSMGTVNFTKINFTLLELIHLIGRVELLNNIMHFKLADVEVFFPRDPLKKSKENEFELPSDNEIEETISKALAVAVEDARKFGMNVSQDDIKICPLHDRPLAKKTKSSNTDAAFVDLEIARNDRPIEFQNLRDYTLDVNGTPDEKSQFVNVTGKNGTRTVRKSSMMWSLSDSKQKVSSDRISRTRQNSKKKTANRQLEFVDVSTVNQPIYSTEEIKVGDWCIFQNVFKEGSGFLLGNILSFNYVSGETIKEKKYTWDFASVGKARSHNKNSSTRNPNQNKEVEILASWYEVELRATSANFKFSRNTVINMQHYVANLRYDVIERSNNNTICLSKEYSKSIMNLLPNFH